MSKPFQSGLLCVVVVLLVYPQNGNAAPEKKWYGRIQIIHRMDGHYEGQCRPESGYAGSVLYDEHFVGVADVGVCGGGMHLGAYNIFSNANFSRDDAYRVEEKATHCTDDRLKHISMEKPGNRREQIRRYSIGNMDRSNASCMVTLFEPPGGVAKLNVLVRAMEYEIVVTGHDLLHMVCLDDAPRTTPINGKSTMPWMVGFSIDVTVQDGRIQGQKDIELSRMNAAKKAINRREIDQDMPSEFVNTVHVNYCFWQESPCDRIQDAFWEDLSLCKAYGNDALVRMAHSGNWSLQQYRDAVRKEAIDFKNQMNPRQPMACESLFQDINAGPNMPVSSGDMSYAASDDTIHNMDGAKERIAQKCMDPVRYQSILRHEEEHRKQATDPSNAMESGPAIDSLHALEPPAYAAGLAVLLDWMQRNCPDAYPDLLSAYQQVTETMP